SAGGGAVMTLSGDEATEAAVKRALPGHAIVHVATHAYVLGDGCETIPEGVRSVGGLARMDSAALASFTQESPLLRSGLALTGANQRNAAGPEADDGILTAEEIAALRLPGTDLVVLSACDTGLGEIRAGEGVFGLRRAFQIAGARTVITSLWSVSDQSTVEWMRAFYQARFARRAPMPEAMRSASLAVLQSRRAQGLSTNPFHWAAFVAVGDWR
ncbi:MAG: CHAT domain-containing protein, partial [Vicinamibacterales bacterium]